MRWYCPFLALVAAACLGACKPPNVEVKEPPISILRETIGNGDPVSKGDMITVDYSVQLPSGKEVLNASDYQFTVGTDSVIRGVDMAVEGMRRGGTRTFTCPPHLHWGRKGYGNGAIPANSDLVITVRLVSHNGAAAMRRSEFGPDDASQAGAAE